MEKVNKDVFISEDGHIFLEEKDCIEYEKYLENQKVFQEIKKLRTLFIGNSKFYGYYCATSEDLDICCTMLQQEGNKNKTCFMVIGIFEDADFYFPVLDYTISNFKENRLFYSMKPYKEIKTMLNFFENQVEDALHPDKVSQYYRKKLESKSESKSSISDSIQSMVDVIQTINPEVLKELLQDSSYEAFKDKITKEQSKYMDKLNNSIQYLDEAIQEIEESIEKDKN